MKYLDELPNPPPFPFRAFIAGVPVDHRRADTECMVLSRLNCEKHYYRVAVNGEVTVVNDSKLYVN